MTATAGEPLRDQLARAFKINQPNIAASADDLPPIGASQCRAGDDPALSAVTPFVDDRRNGLQPRLAIGIRERLAAPHLVDVPSGVEVIALLEFPAELFCEAAAPIVLLPAPETPMTTATAATSGFRCTLHRSGSGGTMLRSGPVVDPGKIRMLNRNLRVSRERPLARSAPVLGSRPGARG